MLLEVGGQLGRRGLKVGDVESILGIIGKMRLHRAYRRWLGLYWLELGHMGGDIFCNSSIKSMRHPF